MGIFAAHAFKDGDKVYLTTPTCERVGFTFSPVPHTHELLDNDLRQRVAKELQHFWKNDDVNRVEALFGIAARIGLLEFLDFVSTLDQSQFSDGVRTVIKKSLTEFGDTIADPYSGLK